MFEWVRLEVFIGIAGAIGVITQLIKLAPVEWTTNYPKIISWVVTAILVGGVGYYQHADINLVAAMMPVFALTANGLYDVVKGVIAAIKSLFDRL